MNNLSSNFTRNIVGYLALFIFCVLILTTNIIYLFIPLLFIYLITDVILGFTRKNIGFISDKIIILLLYAGIIGIFSYILIKYVPIFISDISLYTEHIKVFAKTLIMNFSNEFNLNLDLITIKEQVITHASNSFGHILNIFNNITKGIVWFIFALLLNFLLFTEGKRIDAVFTSKENTLLSYLYIFITERINRFYMYLKKVMLGQIFISLINTTITLVLIYSIHLPYKFTLISLVFLCGLIPVIGNLISNTILAITTLISIGVLPAIFCLVYLVVIHKLEYFLNSKIIGTMIRLPMFITLLALLIGEIMLGLLGMIIAIPLVLTIKQELEEISFKR